MKSMVILFFIIISLICLPILSLAGEKEELSLKIQLAEEQIKSLQLEGQLVQNRLQEIIKIIPQKQDEVKNLREQLDKLQKEQDKAKKPEEKVK